MPGAVVGDVGGLSAGASVTIQPPSGESWQIEHLNLTYSGANTGKPLNDRNWVRMTDGTFSDGYIWGHNPSDSDDRYQAPLAKDVGGPKAGGSYSFDPLKISPDWYLEMGNNDSQSRTYQYTGIKMLP